MQVFPEKRALVLRARHPERLLTVIPTAKRLKENYVAVPHRTDEVRVLTNMGAKVPSPVLYYYRFPGLFSPFSAQRETAAFLSVRPRAYCLNDLGTGKTMAALWAYDYLRSTGTVNKLLVVAPLSTMERAWADEIFRHFPHLTCMVLHGTRAKRLKLLEEQADVYVINHDGLKIIAPALADREDIDIVVIDELAQVARNAQTERWKFLNLVCNKQLAHRWVWGLTGTPTPNSPTDAWAQVRLVTPSAAPPYFRRFKEQVMRQVTQFIWVPRNEAVDVVKNMMQPAIRFSRDECVDLPETMYQTRQVELTPDQQKAYTAMLQKLNAELEGGTVTAVNEAVKISKLVQIACGVVYDNNGAEQAVPCEPRLEVVNEIVETAAAKVIVFVPFVSAIEHVTNYLRNKGHSVASIHGGTSKNHRDEIFAAFQNNQHPRVLVAQPAAMSHGLTLTQANVICWYAPIFSNDIYEQACARITRPGQRHNTFIINIEGTTVERKIYARLKDKQRLQGMLLDVVHDERDPALA